VLPRRFVLIRHIDYTGVSGIGVVAYGVTFADGQVVLRWCSNHPATSMWNSMDDMLAVHGHGEATSVEWIDAPHGDLEGFPGTGGGRRGRRRANRTAVPGTGPGDDEKPSSSPDLPRRPVDRDTTSVSAPGGDEAGRAADDGRCPGGGVVDGPTAGPAGGVVDGPTDAPADGPENGPAGGPVSGPVGQRADSAGPHPDDHAPDAAQSPREPPTRTAPASDSPTQRRERTYLRSVSSDSEPPPAPLLTSADTDKRNGHLYIDTAPLLLTFQDSEDEPALERSQPRRAGRHRRVDPDAGG
jgi:hypothetical protein